MICIFVDYFYDIMADTTENTFIEAALITINALAGILTIIASSIAIFVFFKNKKKIATAINTLLNYSNQVSLNDLKNKIERLNDYNATDEGQKKQVVNILHEIEGQINGNRFLSENLNAQKEKIERYIDDTKLITEPKKRSLVSELRESIRTLDIDNFNSKVTNVKK